MANLDLNSLTQDNADDDDLVGTLRKALRTLKKERDEYQEQVGTFHAQKRGKDLETWLETAKIDPTVKDYVPETVTDAASLAAWLGNEGKLFARLTLTEQPPAPQTPPEQAPSFENSEFARLLGQVSATESGAQSSNPADVDALFKAITDAGANATSEEALHEALANIQLPPNFGQ